MNANHDVPAVTGPKPGAFAMSVDVEDFYQVWAFSSVIDKQSWDGFEFRVGDATRQCLDLFDRHNTKATFFTLGWVAKRDPDLIREIIARGHELASHGLDHTKVNQQSREEFTEDAAAARKLLEDLSGAPVKGYRAAGFSIDAATPWAHEALVEAGYVYSSSTHPIRHDHYGDVHAPQSPFHPVSGQQLLEAPVATVDVFGRRVSCAGGGWFRAMPASLSKALLKRAAKTLDGPVIFYFHPWEIDADQPRIKNAPMKSKARHYLNLRQMPAKLATILEEFHWERVDDALGLRQGCGPL